MPGQTHYQHFYAPITTAAHWTCWCVHGVFPGIKAAINNHFLTAALWKFLSKQKFSPALNIPFRFCLVIWLLSPDISLDTSASNTSLINQHWDFFPWFLQACLFPALFTGAGAGNILSRAGKISYSGLEQNAINICLMVPCASGAGVLGSSHDTAKA